MLHFKETSFEAENNRGKLVISFFHKLRNVKCQANSLSLPQHTTDRRRHMKLWTTKFTSPRSIGTSRGFNFA
jgi:hypothetical protein